MKYHEMQEKHDGLSTFICVFSVFFARKFDVIWDVHHCPTPVETAAMVKGKVTKPMDLEPCAVSFMLRPCDVQINDTHSGAV